jgi:hypothetical protein
LAQKQYLFGLFAAALAGASSFQVPQAAKLRLSA